MSRTKEIINGIKLFLMDMDGTVYLGDKKIDGALEALDILKSKGKKVCFLTNNSSKSNGTYMQKLGNMGIEVSEEELYTSANATVEYLLDNQKEAKVFLLANADVTDYFKVQGVNVVGGDADTVVVCFDTSLTYEKLNIACNLIQGGAHYIVSHPDFVCPAEPYPMPDVGSFMALIKATTGREPDLIIGKPCSEMAERMVKRFGFKRSEIAMVGDRLYTDIRFGVDNGMVSVLVMTGETTAEMLKGSSIQPSVVLNTFSDVLEFVE